MRSLQLCLHRSWDRGDQSVRIPWTPDCLRDLQWWLDLPLLSHGVSLAQASPDLDFWSDASDVGWGAHLGSLTASGLWDSDQASLSINAPSRPQCGPRSLPRTGDSCESGEVSPSAFTDSPVSRGGGGLAVFPGFSIAGARRQASLNRRRISILCRSSSEYLALAARHAVLLSRISFQEAVFV